MNLKPFNLERALAGDPVVTRDGRPVTQIAKFDIKHPYPVVITIGGDISHYTIDGRFFEGSESCGDLFMAQKQVTKWINLIRGKVTEQVRFDSCYLYDSEEAARQEIQNHKYFHLIRTISITYDEP